jgi:hypothetical protein
MELSIMSTADPVNTDRTLFALLIDQPSIISVNGNTAQTLLADLGGTPDGIQIDEVKSLIYWTNMGADFIAPDGTIEVARIDGSQRRLLVGHGEITTPKQLYLDTQHDKLYWCDREGARVMSCRTDGSELTTLIARSPEAKEPRDILDQCVGIAVDHQAKTLYWTQKGPSKGNQGRIFRANLEIPRGEDAAHRSDIETLLDHLPEPIDLEIDTDNGILYWTDRGAEPHGNSLNRAEITKEGLVNYQVICTGFKEAIGLSLDIAHHVAFVADLSGAIYRVDLGSGTYTQIFKQGSITGIALY